MIPVRRKDFVWVRQSAFVVIVWRPQWVHARRNLFGTFWQARISKVLICGQTRKALETALWELRRVCRNDEVSAQLPEVRGKIIGSVDCLARFK